MAACLTTVYLSISIAYIVSAVGLFNGKACNVSFLQNGTSINRYFC